MRKWFRGFAGRSKSGWTREAAILAMLVPLGLTFYAWKISSDSAHEKKVSQFTLLIQEGEAALRTRMGSYQQALLGGAGFFAGSDYVSRSEWAEYVRALDVRRNYPGLDGFGWIAKVSSADVPEFEARMRAGGAPDFKVHPQTFHGDNFIVGYIEPAELNRTALGLNIAFERRRYFAAIWARDTGRPALTQQIRLVRDQGSEPGFLLLLPLYDRKQPLNDTRERRAAFRGWLYVRLVGKIALKNLTHSVGATVDLSVYDASESQAHLVYSSKSGPHFEPEFRRMKAIDIAEQRWLLVWESTERFEHMATNHAPSIILAGGLLLTGLFGGLMSLLARRTSSVRRLARERTRQLQASEQALESSEETFRAAMEHAPIGMALIAPKGRFLRVNEALCRLVGYSRAELQRSDFQSLAHPEDLDNTAALVAETLAGQRQSYQLEQRYFHRDGHIIWILLSVALLRSANGEPRYFVAQIQDITQRREMDRMKREFISTVSHELRTPLTSIRGSLGLMASGALGTPPEKIAALIRIAHTNSERLVRIINDILDIEKIESGKLEIAPRTVSIAEFLPLAVETNEAYGARFNVRFILQPLPAHAMVLADPDRLMQVMSNLLSNAAKFSPSGGEVVVRALLKETTIRVEVEDHGMGIPDAFRARIFEKFAQADSSSSRSFEGSGLGLSISRRLIEAMRGTIGFESCVGRGTTFHFELPRVRGTSVSQPSGPAPLRMLICGDDAASTIQTSAQRVLHVEDDLDLSQVIEAALGGRAQVITASTLGEARDLLRTGNFSLVVLDLTLPDGNGLSLLDDMKQAGVAPPVMILSASEISQELQQRVAVALVKSRVSEVHVVDTILGLMHQSKG